MSVRLTLFLLLLCGSSCIAQKQFSKGDILSELPVEQIPEASGLAPSHVNEGLLWTHNDSGDTPRIFLIDPKTGEIVSTVTLQGVDNRDWEDISTGPGPDGTPHIFVGEIGDNRRVYDKKHIHYFPEPENPHQNHTVSVFMTYSFNLPDETRDSEALTVDPVSGDLYLFSKWEPRVNLYRIPKEGDGYGAIEEIGKVGFNLVTAADISPKGDAILVKTYEYVFLIEKDKDQTWSEAIKTNQARSQPYKVEKQGESICWDISGAGYYTLSEQNPAIYYAPRSD